MSRSLNTARGNRTVDDCFRALFAAYQWPALSNLGHLVKGQLDEGATPARAVRSALLTQDRRRATAAAGARWCQLARILYSPRGVLPFLPAPAYQTTDYAVALASLGHWVASRVRYVADSVKWGQPDHWQEPALTLSSRSGDCEDSALVVWSAAPWLGLPEGRMAIGTHDGDGHTWVEFPEAGLGMEATNGTLLRFGPRGTPSRYHAWMYAYPDGHCEWIA